jgi:hypothetical protein
MALLAPCFVTLVGVDGLVTVCADIVQALEVRILVAGKAAYLAMFAIQQHGMDAELHLIPYLGRGMAVIARQRRRYVVGAEMAAITVGHLDL